MLPFSDHAPDFPSRRVVKDYTPLKLWSIDSRWYSKRYALDMSRTRHRIEPFHLRWTHKAVRPDWPVLPQRSARQTPERLWTFDFILNLLTGHFMFVSYYSLFTIVPPYVLDRGGEEWQIGIIIGSIGVVALFVRPLGGRWIGVLGAKRVAVAGAAIFAITNLLYIPAFSVWWLVPVRMIQGMGIAIGPVPHLDDRVRAVQQVGARAGLREFRGRRRSSTRATA